MPNKEENKMAMPVDKIRISDKTRKDLIRKSSKNITKKYDKTFKLLSKN